MGMPYEEVVNYVKDLDRQNRELVGDWHSNADAFVAAYWEREPKAQAELLDNWLTYSDTFKAAWVALTALAADLLRHGLPLPDTLATWVADVLEAKRGYVNRCVNDIRRRPSQPLPQRRFHRHIERRDRRLPSAQGPSDA